MTKRIIFAAAVVAINGLTAAQTSKPLAPSSKSGQYARDSATKSLTQKSSIPVERKPSSVLVAPSTSGHGGAELAHLEAQSAKPARATPPAAGLRKPAPYKSDNTVSSTGSGINASYQKPRAAHK